MKRTGELFGYENRDHFYVVSVNEFGSYDFITKITLSDKNKPYIDLLKKEMLKNGE